jgi:excisionase family DNA binding protein
LLDQYVDVMEAALRLKINVDTVKRLIRQGRLPATRWGNKYIIDKDQLEMFAATYNPLPGRKRRLL